MFINNLFLGNIIEWYAQYYDIKNVPKEQRNLERKFFPRIQKINPVIEASDYTNHHRGKRKLIKAFAGINFPSRFVAKRIKRTEDSMIGIIKKLGLVEKGESSKDILKELCGLKIFDYSASNSDNYSDLDYFVKLEKIDSEKPFYKMVFKF